MRHDKFYVFSHRHKYLFSGRLFMCYYYEDGKENQASKQAIITGGNAFRVMAIVISYAAFTCFHFLFSTVVLSSLFLLLSLSHCRRCRRAHVELLFFIFKIFIAWHYQIFITAIGARNSEEAPVFGKEEGEE